MMTMTTMTLDKVTDTDMSRHNAVSLIDDSISALQAVQSAYSCIVNEYANKLH